MAKAELKTKKTEASVTEFLNSIKDEGRRKDCIAVSEMMQQITKAEPKMWGSGIVGFGTCVLKYESGRQLDWFICGFASRKAALTLYASFSFAKQADLLLNLGKHKTGKGCLYINSLEGIDVKVLGKLIEKSVEDVKREKYELFFSNK